MVSAVEAHGTYQASGGEWKSVLVVLAFLAAGILIVGYLLKKTLKNPLDAVSNTFKNTWYVQGKTVRLPKMRKKETPQEYVDRLPLRLKPGEGGIFTPEQESQWKKQGGDLVGDMQFALYANNQARVEASILPYQGKTDEAAQANVDWIRANLKGGQALIVDNFYDPNEPQRSL